MAPILLGRSASIRFQATLRIRNIELFLLEGDSLERVLSTSLSWRWRSKAPCEFPL
jgi:hypothetical protein